MALSATQEKGRPVERPKFGKETSKMTTPEERREADYAPPQPARQLGEEPPSGFILSNITCWAITNASLDSSAMTSKVAT